MPIETIYTAQIQMLRLLDEEGRLDVALADPLLSDSDVKSLYEQMIVCREFDEAAFKLQRSGRMGTFPQNKGHEAITLGAAKALRKGIDWIVPYYRENPAMFLHGLPMHYVLLHWMGDERGNAIPANLSMSPLGLAIGTQTLHAVGIAWAFKLRKEDRAVLCFFGEGATSTGDFHEAMNFASLLKAPVIFCCMNNQWAISTCCSKQSAAPTFAQRALAYDMPTIRIDGNDLFASYKATKDAIDRARAGNGPSFIEALTYRLGDHTTADDARRYRPADELAAALKLDPMIRTRKYLESKNLWDEVKQSKAIEKAKAIVKDVIAVAEGIEKPTTDQMFDSMFAELPDELQRQKQTLQTDSIGQDPTQVGLQLPGDAARERVL
ncbi:MAG TPA: pyruvate dehydrogenase (acetyl-transferring) E1 component subunit alpha [Humisphaera sp.]|jgi:pyruvate dehydrogenase E1 component alpha subunit|nr:pyruvate dehydrogenase (acetyl-transferring) E1 component subunit alpha [Humisphaera sp.]